MRQAVAMVEKASGSNDSFTPSVADCASATPTDGRNVPAAVAAPAHSGVVVTRSEIYDMQCTQPWKLNNTALKWFRDNNEHPPGVPRRWVVDLTHDDPCAIGVIQRTKGMVYSLKLGSGNHGHGVKCLPALMKQRRC